MNIYISKPHSNRHATRPKFHQLRHLKKYKRWIVDIFLYHKLYIPDVFINSISATAPTIKLLINSDFADIFSLHTINEYKKMWNVKSRALIIVVILTKKQPRC